ncbi:hypothetical protein [Coleofasciculus sp. E1-EBD-02]|jgi:hypothetical protein|uniref:hypothetical protein n=1 Tax=Coleofasciculus sp. E1-EBD-02 TaxID=3068481 RepID=UPI0033022C09
MEECIGGFIFVTPAESISHAELIHLTIHTYNIRDNLIQLRLQEGEWLPFSSDVAIDELCRAGHGIVETRIAGLHGYVTFEEDVSGYSVIGIKTYRRDWLELAFPSVLDLFRMQWIALCEKIKAEFGYFGNFDFQQEIAYRDQEIIVQLLSYEIDYLVQKAFWLTYLGSPIVSHWNPSNFLHFHRQVEKLASGAFVLHAGRGENPVTGDEIDTHTL